MKTLLLSGAFLISGSFLMAGQIPNADFETWVGGNPDVWTCSNQPGYISVVQDASAHSGNSAARLQVLTVGATNVGGALANYDFAQSSVPPALHGWYKADLLSGDIVPCGVSISQGDIVLANGLLVIGQNTNVYQEFIVNITIVASGVPDNATITFSLAGAGNQILQVHPGSVATIDDLEWGPQGTVGVDEIEDDSFELEKVFPNPAVGDLSFVQYRLSEPSKVVIELYDILGNKVQDVYQGQLGAGRFRAEINTAEIASGMYSVRVQAGENVQTMALVK